MGLAKITINTKYSPVVNIKTSAIMAAMGRAKVYELMHKQIWRKAPHRIWRYVNPAYTHYKGRPVAFVYGWDIKSPQPGPYVYGGGDYTFGLNQLFMGQDPKKPYVGNLKDGIYHDNCYITPKMLPISAEHHYYVYTNTATGDRKTFVERNDEGIVVIQSVVLENYTVAVMDHTETRHRLVVNYVSGATDRVDLGNGAYTVQESVNKLLAHNVFGYVTEYKIDWNISEHGAVIWEEIVPMPYQFTSTGSISTTPENGWIRQYADGTVLQYRPLEVEYAEGMADNVIPGHCKILPMIYTDTGDLTMPVSDFVNNWNTYFELVVHEDSEWWESLLAPIIAIVIIVLSVVTAGAAAVVAAGMSQAVIVGGIISAIGVLSGSKPLSLIGSILSLGATTYSTMAASAATTQLGANASVEATKNAIAGMSVSDVFAGFANVGFGNLVQIGSKLLSIGMNISNMFSATVEETVTDTAEAVDVSEIGFTTTLGKDNSEYDVFGQMSKQFDMY